MSWKDFTANKWTKFGFWALVYLLWVIWLGNFWWLFGLVVVFDIFITRKVHWRYLLHISYVTAEFFRSV